MSARRRHAPSITRVDHEPVPKSADASGIKTAHPERPCITVKPSLLRWIRVTGLTLFWRILSCAGMADVCDMPMATGFVSLHLLVWPVISAGALPSHAVIEHVHHCASKAGHILVH